MATFRPAHVRKGASSCIDHQVVNAVFDCFQTKAIYNNAVIDVTIDSESVLQTDGDYEILGMETVICFKRCQVPNPCTDEQVCVGSKTYNIGKVLHQDEACVCVTVTTCKEC